MRVFITNSSTSSVRQRTSKPLSLANWAAGVLWAEESSEVLAFITESLGGAVTETTLKNGLKDFAASLGTTGPITLEMEKYFAQMPGEDHPKAQRVLELNPDSTAFKAIEACYKGDPEKATKYAKVLYGTALLTAGLTLDDPFEFSKLITSLI